MKSDTCNHANKAVSFECYRWYHFSAMIIRNGKKQIASILAFIIRLNNGYASFVKSNWILHIIKIQKFNAAINISDTYTMMRMVKDLAVYSIDATRKEEC